LPSALAFDAPPVAFGIYHADPLGVIEEMFDNHSDGGRFTRAGFTENSGVLVEDFGRGKVSFVRPARRAFFARIATPVSTPSIMPIV